MPWRRRISTGCRKAGWEFRDRHIWDFSETNVAQITLHQNGKTRADGPQRGEQWSLGARLARHHQPAGHRGNRAPAGRTDRRRLGRAQRRRTGKISGSTPNNLEITVELKNGEKYTVDFGTELSVRANRAGRRHARRRTLGVCFSAGALPVRLELSHHSGERSVICNPASGANAASASAGSASAAWLAGARGDLRLRLVQPHRPAGFFENGGWSKRCTRAASNWNSPGCDCSFVRGLVAENVRLGARRQRRQPDALAGRSPVATGFTARCCTGSCRSTDSFCARENFVWPLSPTNALTARQHPDRSALSDERHLVARQFQADLRGRETRAVRRNRPRAGNPQLDDFSRRENRPAAPDVQAQLQKFSDTLDQIHFDGHAAIEPDAWTATRGTSIRLSSG